MKHPVPLISILILSCATAGMPFGRAETAKTLRLPEFLNQVRENHDGVKASRLSVQGSLERAEEADLVLAPAFFAQAGRSLDEKPNPFLPYNRVITDQYSLGFSEQTSFGLQSKLFYTFTRSEYDGIPALYGFSPTSYYEGRPELDVTQSLWRNGLGSESRASRDTIEAAALASHYGESFKMKNLLAEAESTYWKLALARENVSVQKEATDRSQKIFDWSSRRVKLQLADSADALQAEAALDARQLQLQQAIDDERSASRALNLARGVSSDEVGETIPTLKEDVLADLKVPERTDLRDDVKAAQQNQRATDANAQLAIEKDRPSLDLFGTFAFNSKDVSPNTAFGDSFEAERPSVSFGVKFTAPLDLAAASHAKAGWAREKAAAELDYQRKLLEQESDWTDLNRKLVEAKRRLELATKIEEAQRRKLAHEKERLNHGRTTTYQVLLFEQDFSQAQLTRIQAEADIINIIVQMKIFGSAS